MESRPQFTGASTNLGKARKKAVLHDLCTIECLDDTMSLLIACILVYGFKLPVWMYGVALAVWLSRAGITWAVKAEQVKKAQREQAQ